MPNEPGPQSITVTASPASDSWGFVGVVCVGDVEAFRTLSVHPGPAEAQQAAAELLARALGGQLAAAEWLRVRDETGHVPLRSDLQMGLVRKDRFGTASGSGTGSGGEAGGGESGSSGDAAT